MLVLDRETATARARARAPFASLTEHEHETTAPWPRVRAKAVSQAARDIEQGEQRQAQDMMLKREMDELLRDTTKLAAARARPR